MKQLIKDAAWFVKASYSFMQGNRGMRFWLVLLPKSFSHAVAMRKWRRLTPQQREAWYLSGEGRVMNFG